MILKVRLLHKDMYIIGHRLAKRDKLGLHQTVEESTLELMTLLIEAAFSHKDAKRRILEKARIHSEALKHLVRTEHELDIVDDRTYIRTSKQLVEISKMINGWISYVSKNSIV